MWIGSKKVLNRWVLKAGELMDGLWFYWSSVALAVQVSKLQLVIS